MTEVIVTGGGEDQAVELGEEAERDAFMAAGAAAAHEETAEHHAAAATDAATAATQAAQLGDQAAEAATGAALAATDAESAIGQLISAHTDAMREQTAALSGLVAEIQQSRQAAPPAPAEPKKQQADKQPRSGRKPFAQRYFGR